MAYYSFNRKFTKDQLAVMGTGENPLAVNGKFYVGSDDGIFVGNSYGIAEPKANLTPEPKPINSYAYTGDYADAKSVYDTIADNEEVITYAISYLEDCIYNVEKITNKVTYITPNSTYMQYASAKSVYNAILTYGGQGSGADVSGKEDKSNKVTSIDLNSTDTQYPSAKAVYDAINNIPTGGITEIVWADLKTLRDNDLLTPGAFYRITDYECTTTQEDTNSAGHVFDIIVTADDESHLNENARAAHHSGDTYFDWCKLESWELKYCLDNDTDRFAWADDEDGTGVIFYMKDEWNNECPYDFKNIQFKRKLTDGQYDPDDGTDTWVYTFNWCDENNNMLDASIAGNDGALLNGEDQISGVYDNKIGVYVFYDNYPENPSITTQWLNDNVFLNSYSYDGGYFYGIYGNTFGNNCSGNTFGNDCYDNTFGNDCTSNTFGNDCCYNTFGNDCCYNTFGNGCYCNTFGNDCCYNTFGNNCYNNTFGNDCYDNTFGNGCSSNTFGNGCYDNTFGNNCCYNTFGNGCYSNTFGNGCYSNTFGNKCYYIKITASDGTTNKNYIHHCTFENGVQYCTFKFAATTSGSNPLRNVHFLSSMKHTSQTAITIDSSFPVKASYDWYIGKNSSGTVKQWCIADLIQ